MNIIQTTSVQVIKAILSIDNMYESVSYDGSPSLAEYEPDVKNSVWFILTYDGNTAGLIIVENLNNVLWMPHIYILEKYRGSGSEEWGKQAAQYMRDKYDAKKFLVLTPYKAAKRYAERSGFEYVATLTNSIQKNGKLLDQYMLESN